MFENFGGGMFCGEVMFVSSEGRGGCASSVGRGGSTGSGGGGDGVTSSASVIFVGEFGNR